MWRRIDGRDGEEADGMVKKGRRGVESTECRVAQGSSVKAEQRPRDKGSDSGSGQRRRLWRA